MMLCFMLIWDQSKQCELKGLGCKKIMKKNNVLSIICHTGLRKKNKSIEKCMKGSVKGTVI